MSQLASIRGALTTNLATTFYYVVLFDMVWKFRKLLKYTSKFIIGSTYPPCLPDVDLLVAAQWLRSCKLSRFIER